MVEKVIGGVRSMNVSGPSLIGRDLLLPHDEGLVLSIHGLLMHNIPEANHEVVACYDLG